jgi:hypothetical protein
MSWKRRGGDLEQIQSLEHNNICFYTYYNYRNKLYLPSHTVRCECSNPCLFRCQPSCWQQLHPPCDPWLCCHACVMLAALMAMHPTVVTWERHVGGLHWPRSSRHCHQGLVGFALASTFASFLLAAVSMVTKEERAKFDAVNCWRTMVLLAAVRVKLSRAVPSRSMVAAGAGEQRGHYPMDPPPQTLEVCTGV